MDNPLYGEVKVLYNRCFAGLYSHCSVNLERGLSLYSSSNSSPTTFTVSQLNRQVAQLLEQELGRLWVEGEISNFTQAASGHWYFTIKDDRAAVKAVMFRGRAARVGFMPKTGEKYRFYAAVTMYEPRGDFQLQVESMQRAGLGDLHAEFERLKAKLAAEGLFDSQTKKPIPAMPIRIAVVTSLAAAALRDVVTTMRRRAPHVEVIVYPAAVQGADAAQQLCVALGQAIADNLVQTILLVRGGGSLEDLWSFNDEQLARLIYVSPVPIISGVGHETDFTIADFVADVRAPTPTAAAELSCTSWAQSNADLLGVLKRLQQSQARILERASLRLDRATGRLVSPQQRLRQMRQRLQVAEQRLQSFSLTLRKQQQLDHAWHRLQRCLPGLRSFKQRVQDWPLRLLQSQSAVLRQKKQALHQAEQTLQALSPTSVLDRGYAIVRNQKGAIIKNSLDVNANEHLQVQLAQGHLLVKLKQKHDLL